MSRVVRASTSIPSAIDGSAVDDRLYKERCSPEQMIAGALVVATLILALFGLVLWQEFSSDCWEMEAGSDQSCTIQTSKAGGSTWRPEGMTGNPKSQLLQ